MTGNGPIAAARGTEAERAGARARGRGNVTLGSSVVAQIIFSSLLAWPRAMSYSSDSNGKHVADAILEINGVVVEPFGGTFPRSTGTGLIINQIGNQKIAAKKIIRL
jgi:hypothetical protein